MVTPTHHDSVRLWLLVLLAGALLWLCSSTRGASPGGGSVLLQVNVRGSNRTATVYAPKAATTAASPLVFVFHGHGGTMGNAARSFSLHTFWPEAIVVYPQGLNTPGRLTDPEGQRPGWQAREGGQGNRDLEFFDALLARLRKDYKIDNQRVYATGHSNGGLFVYLLWSTRGDLFAALAPSGAINLPGASPGKALPILHIAGTEDRLVRFDWQKQTIDRVVAHNQCSPAVPAGKHLTRYPSSHGTPVMTFIYPGGHAFPPEAAQAIVDFFKQHPSGPPPSQ